MGVFLYLHGPHFKHLPSDFASLLSMWLGMSVALYLKHKDSIHSFFISFLRRFFAACVSNGSVVQWTLHVYCM